MTLRQFILATRRRFAFPQYAKRRRAFVLEMEIEARDRIIKVLEAERDAMAAVIARDRARIAAETADFNRKRAEAESDGPRSQ